MSPPPSTSTSSTMDTGGDAYMSGGAEGSTSSAAEQARLELTVAASAGERANRPTFLIVGAGLLLAAAAVYTLISLVSWGGQRTALEREVSQTAQYREAIAEYKKTAEQAAARIFDPDPAVGAKLESLMDAAGLGRVPVAVEDGAGAIAKGAKQKQYRATLTDQDPEPVLKWIDLALHNGAISGLSLAYLDMRPGKPMPNGYIGWNVTVKFTRWERADVR